MPIFTMLEIVFFVTTILTMKTIEVIFFNVPRNIVAKTFEDHGFT